MERNEKPESMSTLDSPVSDARLRQPSEFKSVLPFSSGWTSRLTAKNSTRSILTIVGAALATFCTVGFLNAFGVFLDYYQRHLLTDKSAFDLSWLGSFSTFILFLAAAPAGLLVDRFGPTVSVDEIIRHVTILT
jgi:hypothetical protein